MSSSRADFLAKKGAIELLCELNIGGAQFSDLETELEISQTTLTKRIQEGQEVDLIEPVAIQGNRGTTHKYALTDQGFLLQMIIGSTGLMATYQIIKKQQERFDEQARNIRQWLENNPHAFDSIVDSGDDNNASYIGMNGSAPGDDTEGDKP